MPLSRTSHSYIELLILLLILALAAYLRLANVADNPGWYSDEGTHIVIAKNLMQGRVEYMAINQSTLLFAKMPLFSLLLAALFAIWGVKIEVLRDFTGVLGILSVALLYWVVRRSQKREENWLPLLAALMLAIYPQAIFYARLGFSYNLSVPLILLACLGLWEYLRSSSSSWLVLAAGAIGMGMVSDLTTFTFVLPLILVVSARRWRDLLWSLPLVGAPFAVYVVVMLTSAPEAFLFDLRFTMSRLGAVPLIGQLSIAVLNYGVLLAENSWLAPAIVGFFMLRPLPFQRLSLIFFLLPLFIMGRTVGLVGLGFYYLIPLFPFVALGMAGLVRYGTPYVKRWFNSELAVLWQKWGWSPGGVKGKWWQTRVVVFGSSLALFIVVLSPFLISIFLSLLHTPAGFETDTERVLVKPAEARQVADFINSHTGADDVIIASPTLAWLCQAHVADFQQAIAVEGYATVHLPADIPANRFVFDPHYTQARFVVIDNIWRNWAALNMPEVAEMMKQVQQWPLVFKAGEIEGYRTRPSCNQRRGSQVGNCPDQAKKSVFYAIMMPTLRQR